MYCTALLEYYFFEPLSFPLESLDMVGGLISMSVVSASVSASKPSV
jgi:hypothetical protein